MNNRRKLIFFILNSLISCIAIGYFIGEIIKYKFLIFKEKVFDLKDIIILIIGMSFVFFTLFDWVKRKANRPYNIAFIGIPQVGKTTLITSLFQEIFNRKIKGINASPKGESTIKRINLQIEKKEKGLPIGPTTNQTLFAYRTNIETGSGFFKTEYKVEFGDYPGECTGKLTDSESFDEMKKSDFFKWCLEADAYIFLIDVDKYLREKDKTSFISDRSKEIRESWQLFIDYNSDSERKVKSKPVILIFNKMDLGDLLDNENGFFFENIDEKYFEPHVFELNKNNYTILKNKIEEDFDSIIKDLQHECYQFNILYTSSFGEIDHRFAGVGEILRLIFPSNTIFN